MCSSNASYVKGTSESQLAHFQLLSIALTPFGETVWELLSLFQSSTLPLLTKHILIIYTNSAKSNRLGRVHANNFWNGRNLHKKKMEIKVAADSKGDFFRQSWDLQGVPPALWQKKRYQCNFSETEYAKSGGVRGLKLLFRKEYNHIRTGLQDVSLC